MNLAEIIEALNLKPLTEVKDFASTQPSSAYISDLLSCVMSGAKHRSIWITLQSHANIIAVAALLDLSAIIVTEGASLEQAALDKANQEGIVVLGTTMSSFEAAGRLWELGLRAD